MPPPPPPKKNIKTKQNIKNDKMKIVKHESILKVSGKMDCRFEFSVFFTYFNTGQN